MFIHPDLTKREIETNKKLTDELQKLRDEGKMDLQTHRGRIVRREGVQGKKLKKLERRKIGTTLLLRFQQQLRTAMEIMECLCDK